MELNIHAPLPGRKDARIGLLGVGSILDEWHLAAYRKAGFNPVAMAWRDRQQAAQAAQRHAVPKVHDTWEQLLGDPTIEVLDIAVPLQARLPIIQEACTRRNIKGILVNIPLAMSHSQGVEAVRACEAAGLKLAVNQFMRYDHSVRAAKTLLNNGVLGESVFATIELRGVPAWMEEATDLGWLTVRSLSIHHLDTFRYWLGDPEGLYCSVGPDPRVKGPHSDRICTYILEYKSGLRCVGIDDTWAGPSPGECASERGLKWRIEGLKGLALGEIGWGKDPTATPSTIRYASTGQHEFLTPAWQESWLPGAFAGTMAQLLIALENGSEPAIGGRDHLKTMALMDAAYLSAAQFRSIGLHEVERASGTPVESGPKESKGLFGRLFARPDPRPAGRPGISKAEAINNFTPRAQQALALARREADQFNHNFVGTEHLLLGLISLRQGVAVNVLQKLGLNLETLRMEVEKQVGRGPDQKLIGNIPFTPRVKHVLALAAKEAKALNHTYVGTEHILLGLLREGDGVAARVLKNFDVDIKQTRQEILKELDPNYGKPER